MNYKPPYFLGIDVGTQGCRVAVIDAIGNQIAESSEAFSLNEDSIQEQSPQLWWDTCLQLLKQMVRNIRSLVAVEDVTSIAVTSTSGTVIPVDSNYECLHNAIMYSDKRSIAEAMHCRKTALIHASHSYTGFNSSCGLPKMIWFMNTFPDKISLIHQWVHASDFILGKLTGCWNITDHTNVLKSGYDLLNNEWPDYLFSELGLQKKWMPDVVRSGQPVATLLPTVANETGLYHATKVVAGMTDGCASQIASGAALPGDWNTTIGTTMVVKGITKKAVKDPEGRLYNHVHPEGYWMPGGASNIGADWVSRKFHDNKAKLEVQATEIIPTGLFSYPLSGKGERFPFIAPDAVGFEAEGKSPAYQFASNMEGVAFIERFAYDVITTLSGETVKAIYAAGGASSNELWLEIRSSVMNLPVYKMKYVSGSCGAAILAASQTYFSSLSEATRSLTQLDKEVYPKQSIINQYQSLYYEFLDILRVRKYIE